MAGQNFNTDEEKRLFEEGQKKINALDLEFVRKMCAQSYGWTEEQSREAEKQYRQFLTLYYIDPKGKFVASRAVDGFWHMHILTTRQYIKDCEEVFGYYFHHGPVLVEEEENMQVYDDNHEKMKKMRKRLFDE